MESAGRVEVCIHGVWGRICGGTMYGRYGNYSRVVCRQLGYNVDAGEGELNHALEKTIGDGVRCYPYGSRVQSYFVMLGYRLRMHGDFWLCWQSEVFRKTG